MIFNCKEMISQLIVSIKDMAQERLRELPLPRKKRKKALFLLDFSIFCDRLNLEKQLKKFQNTEYHHAKDR